MSLSLSDTDFARWLRERAATLAPGERHIVAIAGPPGAGKSTLVDWLAAQLGEEPGNSPAAVFPMDGYHFDDDLLHAWQRRERKGAPDTFDVGGLRAALSRLKANDEAGVAVPRFDRDLEIARAGALWIDRDVPLVLVEGNYLLVDAPPWDSLAPFFDTTALINVPEEELRRRLRARWEGYDFTEEAIAAKLDDNDLPNGRFVMARSRAPDIVVTPTPALATDA